MTATLFRKAMLICSVAVLCAALIGCSSSDDGKSAELERQLDVEKAARMAAEQERDTAKTAQMTAEQERDAAKTAQTTAEQERDAANTAQTTAEQERDAAKTAQTTAEQERDAAKTAQTTAEQERDAANTAQTTAEQERDAAKTAQTTAEQERDAAKTAQMTAEQTLIDTRNALAADKIRDATQLDTTGYLFHLELRGSGAKYVSLSQSYRNGSQGMALPWYGEEGELEVVGGANLTNRPLQRNPDVWPFRGIYAPDLDRDVEGITNVYGPIEDHGLGARWQGSELLKTYDDGGGTLTFRFFTDLKESDNPGNPYIGHPVDDTNYPNITLAAVSAIPAGWDIVWVTVPAEGLRGSLDGVAGTFTCASGNYGYCIIEGGRHNLAPGYVPSPAADPVIFTPDDGSAAAELPAPQPMQVQTANYVSFGNWLFVPEDVANVDAVDFGVFAGGDDPFMVNNLQGLTGTANYAGEAAGMYAEAATLSSFEAKVALTADFGTADDFGAIAGRVYNFDIDGDKASPLAELSLDTVSWRGGGTTNIFQTWYAGRDPVPGGWIEGGTTADGGWQGRWGGKFFGNGAAAADLPTSFAGTFGATDGERSFAGSFGAHQQ